MMTTLILTFVILLLVVAAMAIGVMFKRKPIQGSCGGIGSLGMKTSCEICGGDTNKCDEQQQSRKSKPGTKLGYDATNS